MKAMWAAAGTSTSTPATRLARRNMLSLVCESQVRDRENVSWLRIRSRRMSVLYTKERCERE